jgi:putative flavoprotein involved in K+ transport
MYTQLVKKVNTIIIGAGQAGLSLSYFLTQKGIEHLILEKGQVGQEWRSRRWDNFHLITPNHMTRLPGFPYKGKNSAGFDSKEKIVKYLKDYSKSFNAPIVENTEVESISKSGDFLVKTNNGDFEAKNVVVAVGSFHKGIIPEMSKSLPKNIFQIHSSQYKNANLLPGGNVLVVGGGNSGIQIAVDLKSAGRKVYLSLGRVRIVPRHYRGKDFMEWAEVLGILDRKTEETSDEIKNTPPPILFGYGETVDLRKIAKDGIQLVGRLKSISNHKLQFDNNVEDTIEKAEAALEGFKKAVDNYITEHNLSVIPSKEGIQDGSDSGSRIKSGMTELNLEEISTIIWSTGFIDDWSFLNLDVFDKNNQPIQEKGISKIPGLYFIGLRWLSKYKSFLLCGVSEDAEYLANQISSFQRQTYHDRV